MEAALERLVRDRSGGRCEYCRLPQLGSGAPFEIDHIIPRKHHGPTAADNLALSCVYFNAFNGPNITGIDPATGRITRLYHPRRHKWAYHFRYQGSTLIGRTPIGRTTLDVLQMNHPEIVALRGILMEAGIF
jgi:HNH endonuclease